MKGKLFTSGLALMLGALIVSGCAPANAGPAASPTAATGGNANMPNPAAVYCQEQGYTSEIRTAADGSQYGVCIFPDGSECDEWAFYRGECGPAKDARPEVEPTAEAVGEVPDGVPAARDAALAFVRERYGERAPAAGLAWTVKRTTPEGLLGSETYEYTAEGWTVTVFYPVVAPSDLVYEVAVANQAAGFQWAGQVDPEGSVTEVSPATGG